MNEFHIYINFPNNLADEINSQEQGSELIKTVQFLIDRADCEDGTILYYDSSNTHAFFEELRLLEEPDLLGYFGVYNFEEIIRQLFSEVGIENWEENSLLVANEEFHYYKQWISADRNAIDDFPAVLKEIAERILRIEDPLEKCLLLNVNHTYAANNPIPIVKDTPGGLPPVIVHVYFGSDFIGLDDWFNDNRVPRVYNLNDNRHIEAHPNFDNRKSPLLGGIGGKNYASLLLATALGDWRETKDLINFDTTKDRYIWYENELTQNQYHGYHLAKRYTHERDVKGEGNIPPRVIALLDYRAELEARR